MKDKSVMCISTSTNFIRWILNVPFSTCHFCMVASRQYKLSICALETPAGSCESFYSKVSNSHRIIRQPWWGPILDHLTVPSYWISHLVGREVTTVTTTVLFCLFNLRLREKPPVSVSIQSRKTMRAHWTVNRPKPGPEGPAAHQQACVFSIYDLAVVQSTDGIMHEYGLCVKSNTVSTTEDEGEKLNAITCR